MKKGYFKLLSLAADFLMVVCVAGDFIYKLDDSQPSNRTVMSTVVCVGIAMWLKLQAVSFFVGVIEDDKPADRPDAPIVDNNPVDGRNGSSDL